MALEGKQLAAITSFQADLKESSNFQKFANYLMNLSPTVFKKLSLKLDRNLTEDTDARGRIVDLVNEKEASSTSESEDDETDHLQEVFKRLFRDENSSVTFEFFTKLLTFPLNLFRGPTKVIYTPSSTYENIKAKLIQCEDNGDFVEFDTYANKMVEQYLEEKDFDIVAGVKIEQARCALYRNDLNKTKKLAREAHEVAEHTRFPPLFHAQAWLMMSSLSRTKRKLGKTKKYLDLAEQSFESGYSLEEFAHFHEEKGTYLDKFLGISAKPDEQLKALALTNFQKMGEIGAQDSRQRVSDKQRFYAMTKSARILLDSTSSFGRRDRIVTKDSIRLAAECLRAIKRDLLSNIPRGSKIQFQLVESDLYYRQGKFEDAMELLKKSLDEAIEFGYGKEAPKITQVVSGEVRVDPEIGRLHCSCTREKYRASWQPDSQGLHLRYPRYGEDPDTGWSRGTQILGA